MGLLDGKNKIYHEDLYELNSKYVHDETFTKKLIKKAPKAHKKLLSDHKGPQLGI